MAFTVTRYVMFIFGKVEILSVSGCVYVD